MIEDCTRRRSGSAESCGRARRSALASAARRPRSAARRRRASAASSERKPGRFFRASRVDDVSAGGSSDASSPSWVASVGALILQRLRRVDDRGLRAAPSPQKARCACRRALQGRDERSSAVAMVCQPVPLGRLLRRLRVEAGEVAASCARSAASTRSSRCAKRPAYVVGPGDPWRRANPAHRALSSAAVRRSASAFERRKLRPRRLHVGLRCRRIEFDQKLAGLAPAGRSRPGSPHLAGLERLDDFDPADRLELALRGGDDVDAAEIGPGEGRGAKEQMIHRNANAPATAASPGSPARARGIRGRSEAPAVLARPRRRAAWLPGSLRSTARIAVMRRSPPGGSADPRGRRRGRRDAG